MKPLVERTHYAKREAKIEYGNTAEYKSFFESSPLTFEKQPETNGRPKRCCVKPVDYGIFFDEDQVHKGKGEALAVNIIETQMLRLGIELVFEVGSNTRNMIQSEMD
ncbi:hypothetical protein RF11_12599 [Thelohanellus kitauei]|uniref:Uncharacterized protein n=1 Tax=Thelohanellus kitauei TaxID=669202 RepID=A0A0C2IZT0_THEKT|nr:hypothetical protein RF11_12599 [Thelohanellus kitauei]